MLGVYFGIWCTLLDFYKGIFLTSINFVRHRLTQKTQQD